MPAPPAFIRADQLLVQRGLAATRSQAQRLIASDVQWRLPDGSTPWQRITKNGAELPPHAELQLLDEALDTLPPRVRQAFLMAQLDGLKQRDIAEALGLSVPTIKKYIQRAWLACLHLVPDD